jgi:peptide/nickel transport system permease protein
VLPFVLRRVGWSVVVLLVASVVLFAFVRATTDPLAQLRGSAVEVSDAARGRALIDAEEHRLGLDRPLASQYGHWLRGFVRGDWGQSILSHRSVAAEIRQRLWNTMQLAVWAIALSITCAIAVGYVSAARRGSLLDHGLAGLAFLFLSMPPFWFALMAIEWLVFVPKNVFHLSQPLLFSVGTHSATGAGLLDYPRHLALPVLTLSLPLVSSWSRYVRAAMLDELSAPYVRLARSKGLSRPSVLLRHALRNALIPFTTVSALSIGYLFGGVIVVETIFAWPGMGQLLYTALLGGDTNVLLPWLMVAATFVLVLNLVADILYGALDPRIRVS